MLHNFYASVKENTNTLIETYRTGENDLKLVAVSHNLEYGLKRHVQPLLVEAQFSLRKPALFAQIFPTKLIACGLAQCICIGM